MYLKRIFIAVIVILICAFIFTPRLTHFNQNYRFKNENTNIQNQYEDLFCAIKGKWILKPDITEQNREDVLKMNADIRKKKGWSTENYRSDQKCGKSYPINNNGLPIAAQCDVNSDNPCCSPKGICSTDCSCNGCIDYPSTVYPELYQWKPSTPGCDTIPKNQNESCTFLSKHFTSVTFIGDSLIRHLYTAILIHLTNDDQFGGLSSRLSQTEKMKCQFDLQFGETLCRAKIPFTPDDIKANNKFCPVVKNKIDIRLSESYDILHAKEAYKIVEPRFAEKHPLIILGVGLHDNLDPVAIQKGYLEPIIKLSSTFYHSNPVFVWANVHYGGLLKPLQYESFQGNHKAIPFNKAMQIYCKENGIHVFETFELSRGVFSFDGQHYGSSLNKVKIQSLMKGLSKIFFMTN